MNTTTQPFFTKPATTLVGVCVLVVALGVAAASLTARHHIDILRKMVPAAGFEPATL